MKTLFKRPLLLLGLLALLLVFSGSAKLAAAQSAAPLLIVGQVLDSQNTPVTAAHVTLIQPGLEEALSETETQEDGRFTLVVPVDFSTQVLAVSIERHHFATTEFTLSETQIAGLHNGQSLTLPTTTLARQISLAFWIAALVFIGILALVATGKLHTTLAALLGTSLLLGISYLGKPISPDLYVFDFERALGYIDWNVIFLVMGMMIVIAIVENTGIFQWMAFFAYRASGGRMWLLLPILMLITGVASAFLDNVTTMLLMTPITVQIALALGINPLALLMPEVMASNVIGVSTLVGTPTNILIGSYGNLSFNDFLNNLTPGVLLAFIGLAAYSWAIYRKDMDAASAPTERLLEKLRERGKITQPEHLRKAGWVGAGMLLLFVFGEQIHLLPAVTALMGATALLVWIQPDIEEMIEAVDWTTLVFFMGLFIVVGGVQEVGLISIIADGIGNVVGDNLVLAMLAVIWLSALLSMVIANIPFTAAMLPVVGFLTATIPGADTKVLYYCLSVGAAMGGNGSLIGASANMVTAGIAEAAGFRITYPYFLKKGFPAVLITVSLATVWLLIRFT